MISGFLLIFFVECRYKPKGDDSIVNLKTFGKHMAKLRKAGGFTGEQFAELLNVSSQAVSKWETGKNLPETALLPAISKLLGVSIDSLFAIGPHPVKLFMGGRYIDGVPMLRWGQSQDCTWAGAATILLNVIGVNLTYWEVMGFSGACYYFSMTPDWCPSAAMLQVAYDPAATLIQSMGIERVFISEEGGNSQVRDAIKNGMPVMIIQPRVEMEWGVLCGYMGEDKFYGRSYFDYISPEEKDIFTDNRYYLADGFPGADPNLMCFYRSGEAAPLPVCDALRLSLETARKLYALGPMHNGRQWES